MFYCNDTKRLLKEMIILGGYFWECKLKFRIMTLVLGCLGFLDIRTCKNSAWMCSLKNFAGFDKFWSSSHASNKSYSLLNFSDIK